MGEASKWLRRLAAVVFQARKLRRDASATLLSIILRIRFISRKGSAPSALAPQASTHSGGVRLPEFSLFDRKTESPQPMLLIVKIA